MNCGEKMNCSERLLRIVEDDGLYYVMLAIVALIVLGVTIITIVDIVVNGASACA